MPIRDMRNTSALSELAHKQQEPIFITKKDYSDLVVMSAEYFDRFARENRIDQAIFRINENRKVVYVVTVQYQGRDL